jgi:hypothetical protein
MYENANFTTRPFISFIARPKAKSGASSEHLDSTSADVLAATLTEPSLSRARSGPCRPGM